MRGRLLLGCATLVLASGAAHADRWGPPGEQTYVSPGQEFRLTVLPRVLVSSHALSDFLTKEQIAQLFVSVSSIHWGGAHRFDDTSHHLVLEIVKSETPWLLATLSLESPAAGFRVSPAPRDRP